MAEGILLEEESETVLQAYFLRESLLWPVR
jgi:hypothetical protein